MKKQLRKQKLQVKVEKVRNLKPSETEAAQGGAVAAYTDGCYVYRASANCALTNDGCCAYSIQK